MYYVPIDLEESASHPLPLQEGVPQVLEHGAKHSPLGSGVGLPRRDEIGGVTSIVDKKLVFRSLNYQKIRSTFCQHGFLWCEALSAFDENNNLKIRR